MKDHLKEHAFKPGRSGNPNGRPKKIHTILKKKGYSADDIRTAFGELAFYNLKELNEVATDSEKPIIARIVAKSLYRAFKDSDWSRIREIMEHVIGRPKQEIEGIADLPMAVYLIEADGS